MAEEEVSRLRAEAERCRRLAENMHHVPTEQMLRRMAEEFDEAADKLKSKPGTRHSRVTG